MIIFNTGNARPINREDRPYTDACVHDLDGRSPRHWARMHFLGNGQIERAHKYHKIIRFGGGSRATGAGGTTHHRQRRREIQDLHGTRHFTRGIIYTRKGRRPQYPYVQAALVRGNARARRGHARGGLARLLSLCSRPHLAHGHLPSPHTAAGLVSISGSPIRVLGGVLRAPWGGEMPREPEL